MPEKLSIVVPCCNEEEALPLFYERLSETLSAIRGFDFEIIFVDGGSSDQTLSILKTFARQNKQVRYLSLSRNFGKEAAIVAGLRKATGDLITVMDADLQDPPDLLPQMIDGIEKEGFDSVATRRSNRKGEGCIRSFFARLFYWLINRISSTKIVSGARDYRMMTRRMLNAVLEVSEYNRFTKGIYSWVGFKTKWLDFENVQRTSGCTKWSFFQLFFYSLEGILAFSTVPLAVASWIGILFCLFSFLGIIAVVLQKLFWGGAAYGWSSLVCILFFVSGIQLFCLGILGQYLAKTYLETKRRPLYIIREESDGPDLL